MNIAPDGAAPLYVELLRLDPSFPAFQHCPKHFGPLIGASLAGG